jgi:hypothetical protein
VVIPIRSCLVQILAADTPPCACKHESVVVKPTDEEECTPVIEGDTSNAANVGLVSPVKRTSVSHVRFCFRF